jgi:hypothetical protein
VHPNLIHCARLSLLVLALNVAAACSKEQLPEPPAKPLPSAAPGFSRNNRLKFKGGTRIVADLSAALGLEQGELCKELGAYDCKATHNIPLGGVEPYVQTIYSPVNDPSTSTANAAERIALYACHQRTEQDFATPAKAKIFAEMAANAANATPVQAEQITKRLYRTLLQRDATADEIRQLAVFWTTLSASEKEPAKAFATYSCFAIATSEEALFY